MLPYTRTVQILGHTFRCRRRQDQVARQSANSARSLLLEEFRRQPVGAGLLLTHSPVAHTPIREGLGDPLSATSVLPTATDASKKRPEFTGIWTMRFYPRLIVSKRGFCGGWECLEKPSNRRGTFGSPSWFRRRLGTPPWAPRSADPARTTPSRSRPGRGGADPGSTRSTR